MNLLTNHSISVDCVIFGFDGAALKVLLIRRCTKDDDLCDYKLPGSLIQENEDLSNAAYRVLRDHTGMSNIFLRQFSVFSDPTRISGDELEWLNAHYGVHTERVVTVTYYSLIKLSDKSQPTRHNDTEWVDVQSVKRLAMDHKQILIEALTTLNKQFIQEPIAFELLPRKFTIRQLQNLYEAILGIEIDNRNFRKKVLSCGYLTATAEREKDVAHKPAIFYTFNKSRYEKDVKKKTKLNFINWQG